MGGSPDPPISRIGVGSNEAVMNQMPDLPEQHSDLQASPVACTAADQNNYTLVSAKNHRF